MIKVDILELIEEALFGVTGHGDNEKSINPTILKAYSKWYINSDTKEPKDFKAFLSACISEEETQDGKPITAPKLEEYMIKEIKIDLKSEEAIVYKGLLNQKETIDKELKNSEIRLAEISSPFLFGLSIHSEASYIRSYNSIRVSFKVPVVMLDTILQDEPK